MSKIKNQMRRKLKCSTNNSPLIHSRSEFFYRYSNFLPHLFLLIFLSQTMSAQEPQINSQLQQILVQTIDNKLVFGTSFAVKKGEMVWYGAAGNLNEDSQFFIASTTKLFTSAIILKLRSEGKLQLDDQISKYIDESILRGLHLNKGQDYTSKITVRHLLSHTSGLADYFQDQSSHGQSLESELKNGKDQSWGFEEVMERAKNQPALFIPGKKGKAHYSDTNFQLLGRIIENITQMSFADCCMEFIIQPLGLSQTYLYTDENDRRPANIFFKDKELMIPKAMSSFGPDGGMVSTTHDMLVFIESFFEGKIFPKEYFEELKSWNRIFFPMRSGVGIHQFKLPWIFNPFGAVPEFIGHSGLSGALAYYSPQENLYIVGTVNQIDKPDISFRTMIKLARVVMKG